MARDKRSKYEGVDTSLASSFAYDRFIDASGKAERERTQAARLRSFLAQLANPAKPTAEEARAGLHIAGLAGVEVEPDDPRAVAVFAPSVVLTTSDVMEFLPGLRRPSARALLQRMRDEGRVTSVGRGEWQIEGGAVQWPSSNRFGAGWVVTSRGTLYAIPE